MQGRPTWRVRWKKWSGDMTEWYACIEQPRLDQGCLIMQVSETAAVLVPLHTITAHIEVEALQVDGHA